MAYMGEEPAVEAEERRQRALEQAVIYYSTRPLEIDDSNGRRMTVIDKAIEFELFLKEGKVS